MAEYYQYPIYAKDPKEIPDWMKASQNWENAVSFDKLQKLQLKVKMCCSKCEEKVVEEIREVHGVFEVKGERFNSKVVVALYPTHGHSSNEHEVLRRARKVDKKAKFVELDAKEKPKTEEQKKKEAEEKKKKEEEEKKKKKEEQMQKDYQDAVKRFVESKQPVFPIQYWSGGPYPGEYFSREYIPFQKEEEEKKKKKEEQMQKDYHEAVKRFVESQQPVFPIQYWSGEPYPGEYFFREYIPFQKEEEEKKQKKEREEKEKEEHKKKDKKLATPITANFWGSNGPWHPVSTQSHHPHHPYRHPEDSSSWYEPRFHFQPPLPFHLARDEFSQPYFLYH